jgi:hypothetical protein
VLVASRFLRSHAESRAGYRQSSLTLTSAYRPDDEIQFDSVSCKLSTTA